MDVIHLPVLLEQVVTELARPETSLFVDATVGGGGHAYEVLERYPQIILIGMDVDDDALEAARGRLKPFGERAAVIRGNFRDVKSLLARMGRAKADAILADLGLSSMQLASARGFSFNDDAPLDMRMDSRGAVTAGDVVNGYGEARLRTLFRDLGEEWRANAIARAIVRAREKAPIGTARELAAIVARAKGRRGRIHPATKVFQALRMEVNDELGNLRELLAASGDLLAPGGRIGVISFHSLEDRIVKEAFRGSPLLTPLTKKPIVAEKNEIGENPRARSAKLRIAERR